MSNAEVIARTIIGVIVLIVSLVVVITIDSSIKDKNERSRDNSKCHKQAGADDKPHDFTWCIYDSDGYKF